MIFSSYEAHFFCGGLASKGLFKHVAYLVASIGQSDVLGVMLYPFVILVMYFPGLHSRDFELVSGLSALLGVSSLA